MEMVYRI